MNVGYLLTNSARKFPKRLAVIADEGRYTFEALDYRTDQLAKAMLTDWLKKGDRVAILFFNGVHFAETYFAAIKAGLVATPINTRLAMPEILHLIQNARPKILFYDASFEARLEAVRDRLGTVRRFVSSHPGDRALAVGYDDFGATGENTLLTLPHMDESDPCQLMYTSGTTGRPKGAVLTHGNIIWNLFNTIRGREDQPGERAVIVGPLFHTAALNNHFTVQVALGGTSILVRKFEPVSLLKTIQKERATVMSGAPALYNMLINHPKANTFDVSSITKCTAGADKLTMETKKRIVGFFPNIQGVYDVYGCTEASPSITILGAGDSMGKDLSVGKALPFLDARVVDENHKPLPPGEVGEIVCQGANVMKGYYEDSEATKSAIRDGWLHTGDLARMDEEGFFYIVDRKKDMIVSGGENIYPREVENILMEHPAIEDVAVVGIPDADWGESVKAFVVPKAGQSLDKQTVIDFCRPFLADYKKPKSVAFVDAIPKNPLGKVQKHLLREDKDSAPVRDDSG